MKEHTTNATSHQTTQEHLHRVQVLNYEKVHEHLEAFNDGVIAIIITIMALEIPIPHTPAAYPAFAKAIIIFLISFFITGNFWYHLTSLYTGITRSDKRMVVADFLFLADLALLPVMTAWIIDSPQPLAVVNYGVVYLIAQLLEMGIRALTFQMHLEATPLSSDRTAMIQEYRSRKVKVRTCVLFALNGALIISALWVPRIAIYMYLALPVCDMFLPNLRTKLLLTEIETHRENKLDK